MTPKGPLLGAHTSASGGVWNALKEGASIGATTIQLFTSNQKQWKGRVITPEIVEKWQHTLEQTQIQDVMCHDSYLINLGSPNPEVLEKSIRAFQEEIQRCHALGIPYLNFHPGSALKTSPEQCLDLICDSLTQVIPLTQHGTTRLLLETTAGQGSQVGWKFSHLSYILDRMKDKVPLGVCIDTCHIFAAGYDLRTKEAVRHTLDRFDQEVGLEHLYAFHLNDSKRELGDRVDRHAPLGQGCIGWECFEALMQDERVKHLPKYLETPGGCPLWTQEIATLKQYYEHKLENTPKHPCM